MELLGALPLSLHLAAGCPVRTGLSCQDHWAGIPQRSCGPSPLSHSPDAGVAAAPCKPGCAAHGLVAGAESVRVCLHQGPLAAPLEVCTSARVEWTQVRVGGPHRWGSQSVCLGILISGSSGTPRPFLSAQQGTGPQASKWPEMALGSEECGGDKSYSSTGSAQLWLMLLLLPSRHPAFCNR